MAAKRKAVTKGRVLKPSILKGMFPTQSDMTKTRIWLALKELEASVSIAGDFTIDAVFGMIDAWGNGNGYKRRVLKAAAKAWGPPKYEAPKQVALL